MGRLSLVLACLALAVLGSRASMEACANGETCSESEDGSLMQVKREVPAVPHSASDPNGCSGIYESSNNHGVNIGGDNPWEAGGSSAGACQSECSKYGNGCKGWTWTGGKCYLKSEVCEMQGESYVQSGYCYPWNGKPYGSSCGGSPTPPSPTPPSPSPSGSCSNIWENSNNNGENLNSNPEPGCSGAEDCKQRCSSAYGCKGWTWVKGSSQCWLKSSVECMTPVSGYDDAQSGYCDPWWGPNDCGYQSSKSHMPR